MRPARDPAESSLPGIKRSYVAANADILAAEVTFSRFTNPHTLPTLTCLRQQSPAVLMAASATSKTSPGCELVLNDVKHRGICRERFHRLRIAASSRASCGFEHHEDFYTAIAVGVLLSFHPAARVHANGRTGNVSEWASRIPWSADWRL